MLRPRESRRHRLLEQLKGIGRYMTPDVLRHAAKRALDAIRARRKENPDRAKRLKGEIRQLDGQIERYVAAIGHGR